MATVTFYSGFSKRPNSTKQPTSGTDKTVVLKESTSIENPTFILNEALSSVAGVSAAKWDSRYYFVTDVTSAHNGITEISCALDRGATFKSDIVGSAQYIERGANTYNTEIIDPEATNTDEVFFEVTRDTNAFPGTGTGYVCVQCVSKDVSPLAGGGVGAYFLQPNQDTIAPEKTMYRLIEALYNTTLANHLKTALSDAFSSIIKVTYIPWIDLVSFTTPDFVQADICLGDQDVNTCQPIKYAYTTSASPLPKKYTWTVDLDSMAHFQTFKWRNRSPYSVWKLYLPLYGVVDISPDEYINDKGSTTSTKMIIECYMDYVTGDVTYIRKKQVTNANATTSTYILQTYKTCIGIDIPLSMIKSMNINNIISGAMQAGAGSLLSNPAGLVTGALNGITGFFEKGLSTAGGSLGTGVSCPYSEGVKNIDGDALQPLGPRLAVYQFGHEFELLNYDTVLGGPVMKMDNLSNYAGSYVKTRNASVSIAGTQADKDAVNAMLDSGMFLD